MTAPYWWRSLEEQANDPAFLEAAAREAPGLAAALSYGVDRRRALQLLAASMALAGVAGCGPREPATEIVPRVDQVPGETPGLPRKVATAVVREGWAVGVVATERMGRPVMLEGNPDHPASLGAIDPVTQAALLDLYDPDRSATVLGAGRVRAWNVLERALADRAQAWRANGGAGLRILTGTAASPSLTAQLAAVLKAHPNARWHRWSPLARDAADAGGRLAFGRAVEVVPMPGQADIVLGIESDMISSAPGHLAHARGFARRRRAAEAGRRDMSRVYAIEPTPTLLGARADHRFILKPAEIEHAVRWLAGSLGAAPAEWASGEVPPWMAPLARDLKAHPGTALVHAGAEQSPAVHALVHAMNAALGAPGKTVRYLERTEATPEPASSGLGALVEDMRSGRVDTLIILGLNPVYEAQPDLRFGEAFAKVPFSLQLATHVDETAAAVTFHAPELHAFETWSDARAFEGTVSIIQPLVRPLVPGRSALEILALLTGADRPQARLLVNAYWRAQAGAGDFDATWSGWLRKGVVDGTAWAATDIRPVAGLAASLPAPQKPAGSLEILFRPDPFLRAGEHANNGWMQELPRPFTRLVWDNAALMAPATAARLALHDHDVVELTAAGGKIQIPVLVLPGQAQDCVTLSLGYGRTAGGRLATGTGVDVNPLRRSASPWLGATDTWRSTGEQRELARTQHHQTMVGRDIVRTMPVADFLSHPPKHEKDSPPSLYPEPPPKGNAWGMAISLNACIGCGACVSACQNENNIPIVGREEILRDREMQWIRIDRYWGGSPEDPEILFQPVPCMHCENAPCEVVCPVDATMHDTDGLNVMVYNRCVGTRFCSNNCPYKVRRFNFFGYAASDPRPSISWNPDVTVRGRGVMEKCTYCIQRIREAEITADRENRGVRDGEVRTACQQACPADAIVFGQVNNPKSEVSVRKSTPLDYALLEELNTRPRTTYAARLKNPNPEIKGT